MRAMAIEEFGGPDKLRLVDLPEPRPRPGEVLIRIVAAGCNPVDWKIREGWLRTRIPHAFPLIPGWDVAGTVEDLGEGATRFRRGERVWAYARKAVVQWGAYAELIALAESQVASMPSKLLFEEAASIPLAGLTAFQSLFGTSGIEAGDVVLVHAAAGGCGHFAVQLAKNAGARVLGTAGTANREFVLGLGADEVIDYTRESWSDAVDRVSPEGVNLVFDTVGGQTQVESFDVLKPGGRLVSIVAPPDPALAARRGVVAEYVFVEPNADQLAGLAGLVNQGKLRTHVSKIYPLADAAQAQKTSQAGHVRGKLVLAI